MGSRVVVGLVDGSGECTWNGQRRRGRVVTQQRMGTWWWSGLVLGMLVGLSSVGRLQAQEPRPTMDPPIHSTPEKESNEASAPKSEEVEGSILSIEQLACMSECELEAIYRQGKADGIPCGFLKGKVLYGCAKGSGLKGTVSGAVWKGKIFKPEEGILVNQWIGLKAVQARVHLGESWMDGGPAIITDYQGMSHVVWKNARDEIREISPGLFLGVMYVRKCPEAERKMFFALEAPCSHCP